jgi:hypothetical protein
MSDHTGDYPAKQQKLFETEIARAMLDQLLADSRLYTLSKDYEELLDFVVRLRNFAPFNAMLLQVQKPGLSYAASARAWRERFGRTPKEGSRPLLILWPFGFVALVYDVRDTEGEPLPEDVASFFAHGRIDANQLATFVPLMRKKGIEWCLVNAGDRNAGSIRVLKQPPTTKKSRSTECTSIVTIRRPSSSPRSPTNWGICFSGILDQTGSSTSPRGVPYGTRSRNSRPSLLPTWCANGTA